MNCHSNISYFREPSVRLASVLQSKRPPAAYYKEPKQKETMTTIDYLTIAYLVMAIITALVAYKHLANPRFYRAVCSIVAGVFWLIPVGLIVFLYIEGCIVDAAKWITKHFD